jgi:N utilization substance protein B
MTEEPATAGPRGKRAAARIAAVQALYQIDMVKGNPADVIAEFRDHRLTEASDKELFAAIVANASVRGAELDELIRPVLAEGWKLERLDAVLRAVLRAGVGELQDFPDVPARVIIDQYLDVAHVFFTAKEAGFVNGVLDNLARRLRPQEIEARRVGQAAEER